MWLAPQKTLQCQISDVMSAAKCSPGPQIRPGVDTKTSEDKCRIVYFWLPTSEGHGHSFRIQSLPTAITIISSWENHGFHNSQRHRWHRRAICPTHDYKIQILENTECKGIFWNTAGRYFYGNMYRCIKTTEELPIWNPLSSPDGVLYFFILRLCPYYFSHLSYFRHIWCIQSAPGTDRKPIHLRKLGNHLKFCRKSPVPFSVVAEMRKILYSSVTKGLTFRKKKNS